MDSLDRTPWGPWTDYGRSLVGAEEAVAVAIENILTDGGHLLWQKYLERKAFAFASNSIAEVLVSQLRMCFVPYDEGEPVMDEGWTIEEEPEPNAIDSWARMYLPVRRPVRGDDQNAERLSAAAKARSAERTRNRDRKANSALTKGGPPGTANKAGKPTDKSESRTAPLTDHIELDEQEERLRDAKALEESRRRDKEVKLKQSEKSKDEERKKVQQLHEEMSKRAHTFDNEGNLIWVEEVKLERLPKVQEAFGYNLKRDARPRQAEEQKKETAPSSTTSPVVEKAGKNKRAAAGPNKSSDGHSHEFTDFFSKLQHGQPPILETMAVQPGVTLESMGKKKAGTDSNQEGHMSRNEYVQLAEREEAMGSQFRPSASTSAEQTSKGQPASSGPGGSPGRKKSNAAAGGAPEAASAQGPAAAAEGSGGGLGTTLPPLQQGSSPPAPGGPAVTGYPPAQSPPKTGVLAQAQKEPAAPPPSTRSRKYESIGHLTRPPRYHPPKLGGQFGHSAAQPPLGATMGHGLVRHGSLKEAYFFPGPTPELPLGLLRRSASEAGPGSGRRSPKGEHGASQGDADLNGGGSMKAEMSPAYRNFRHALLPGGATNHRF